MPEHTPTPSVGRAFYGFAIYLIGWALIVLYLCWAFVPHAYLEEIGITYIPQPYWVLAVPSFIVTLLLLFVFCIYPAINMTLVVPPNDIRTLRDRFSISEQDYEDLGNCSVPPIYDIHISEVCRNLYGS